MKKRYLTSEAQPKHFKQYSKLKGPSGHNSEGPLLFYPGNICNMRTCLPQLLERETGVEPAALGLGSRCSTTELFPHILYIYYSDILILMQQTLKALSQRSMTFGLILAELTRVELAISGVTGRHVRPLHHSSLFKMRGCTLILLVGDDGIEPPTPCL